jgi:AcrR family transcriptional regulator
MTDTKVEPPKRRRGSPRERVGKDRVMTVALKLFLVNGYAGTSVKSVADELGISPPALYWYFESKEELYVAVIEQAMQDFITYVRDSLTDSDPVFRLSQLVRAHVTWQLQQSDVARTFDMTVSLRGSESDIPREKLEPIRRLELAYIEEVRSILRNGVKAGSFDIDDIKTMAFAIVTLCEYVTTWYRSGGGLSVPAVANRYEGIVRRMVGVGTVSAATDQSDV